MDPLSSADSRLGGGFSTWKAWTWSLICHCEEFRLNVNFQLSALWWTSTSSMMTAFDFKRGSASVRVFGNSSLTFSVRSLRLTRVLVLSCANTLDSMWAFARVAPTLFLTLICAVSGPDARLNSRSRQTAALCSQCKYQSRRAALLFWGLGAQGGG